MEETWAFCSWPNLCIQKHSFIMKFYDGGNLGVKLSLVPFISLPSPSVFAVYHRLFLVFCVCLWSFFMIDYFRTAFAYKFRHVVVFALCFCQFVCVCFTLLVHDIPSLSVCFCPSPFFLGLVFVPLSFLHRHRHRQTQTQTQTDTDTDRHTDTNTDTHTHYTLCHTPHNTH